jgi:trehalose 6-phosphate synthase
MTDHDHVPGYDLVLAASSLPIDFGPLRWRDRAGSIARVLRAAVADRGGTWIGCVTAPATCEAALLDRVWLDPVVLDGRDEDDFVYGHCASTLAPLYLDNGVAPRFDSRWRTAYRSVNERVADAIARSAAPGATVWIHDYHLQLVPGYARARRPDARIGFFLHSPFPPADRFNTQPLRDEIRASLLTADHIGFQDERSAANFADALGMRGRRAPIGALRAGRPRVGVFPVSVDADEIRRVATAPRVVRTSAALRASLGNPEAVLLSIGSPDQGEAGHRMIEAYAELLAERLIDPDDVTLIYVSVCADDPSHLRCDRQRLDRRIAQINGVHGRLGRPAIHYIHREQSFADLVALYRTADALLALPLRDGMSLAAKEFIAARVGDTGRLVLSEFSGAAQDLLEADIVNPNDIDQVKRAIVDATADCHRPTHAMRSMRQRVHRHDADAWSHRVLAAIGDVESTFLDTTIEVSL